MTEDDLKHETENLGLSFDKLGLSPLAGRVLAYLMLSETPFRTFDEIVVHLQASKSSVSTTLKYLEQMEMISYKTLPGDRKRYFKVEPTRWVSLIKVNDKIRTMISVFDHVLALKKQKDPEIKEIRDLYLYLETEIPKLFQRWEQTRKKYS